MVIQTPRLCNDVAFQPAQKDEPNEITCRPVLKPEEVDEYEQELAILQEGIRLADEMIQQEQEQEVEVEDHMPQLGRPRVVGGIEVGAHVLVPHEMKLEKSAIVGGGKEKFVDTIANSEGRMMTKTELEKLGLGRAKGVDELTKRLEEQAAGRQWKLIAVDTPAGREYRGIIGEDDEQGQDDAKTNDNKDEQAKDDAADQGSEEEYYKEEL